MFVDYGGLLVDVGCEVLLKLFELLLILAEGQANNVHLYFELQLLRQLGHFRCLFFILRVSRLCVPDGVTYRAGCVVEIIFRPRRPTWKRSRGHETIELAARFLLWRDVGFSHCRARTLNGLEFAAWRQLRRKHLLYGILNRLLHGPAAFHKPKLLN